MKSNKASHYASVFQISLEMAAKAARNWTSALGLLACFLLLTSTGAAQPTFFATQTEFITRRSILYRFTASSSVSTFLLTAGLTGMTTVPPGVTVGNMNGGAKGGDIIGFTGVSVHRLDDAFGSNPHLVQIGVTNTLGASPAFVGNRLFSTGGGYPIGIAGPPSVYITEVNPLTFTELWRESTGIFFAGSGGMFHVSGLTFRFVEHTTDRLYEYTLGSGNTSANLGKTTTHDYAGLEQFEGTVYATFSMPQTTTGARRFGFGTIDRDTGSFTEQRVLDIYRDGITGLTVATPNHPPVANAGSDVSVGCEGLAILNGSGSSDPDGYALSYAWYKGGILLSDEMSPALSLSAGSHTLTLVVTDPSGATSSDSVVVTVAAMGFQGFLSPIGGADATGGSFTNPLRTVKLGSNLTVKFRAFCCGEDVLTGIHRLQLTKYTSATTAQWPIDATSTLASTIGNQFDLIGNHWQFNLDTSPLSSGTWQLTATLSDNSQHIVWITIKP